MDKDCLLDIIVGIIANLTADGLLVVLFRDAIKECFEKNHVKIPKTKNFFSWLLLKCDFQHIKKQKREILIVHKFYIFHIVFSLLSYLSFVLVYFVFNPTVCFYVMVASIIPRVISHCIVRIVLYPEGIRTHSIFSKRYKKK